MFESVRHDRLVPEGLMVEHASVDADGITIVSRSSNKTNACPLCGTASQRVHSRYRRELADLPAHGARVRVRVLARRFRCTEPHCRRRIFAERFDVSITLPSARRTTRLEQIVHHLGLALGGRPAARTAQRLMMPVSKDTLLRTVRRHATLASLPLTAIGIDDWAWKRGHRYGTVICDLTRRRIVDLLPDREPATVAAWLSAHPTISIVARDRGGGYGGAVANALPAAVQVADRWHLFENASAAFLGAVRMSMPAIRTALGAGEVDPALLTRAEQRQYEGYLRRQESNAAVLALAEDDLPIKAIARQTGLSRKTVRRIMQGARTDIFRTRRSALEPWLGTLGAEWDAGCRNGARLWRRLRAAGYQGGLRVVTEWATRRRRSESAAAVWTDKATSARSIVRMLTLARHHLTRQEAVMTAMIEEAVPRLITARDLLDRFHAMIRRQDGTAFDRWLNDASDSLLSSFAIGIVADRDAVEAAICQPWSNGQTEGQITKLKLVKRQMYGRAKIDLLRARLVTAP